MNKDSIFVTFLPVEGATSISTGSTDMRGERLPILTALEKREMQTPGLLFLASHRPLAFLVAQILYLVDPIAGLIGWQECANWAAILTEPEKMPVTNIATKIG